MAARFLEKPRNTAPVRYRSPCLVGQRSPGTELVMQASYGSDRRATPSAAVSDEDLVRQFQAGDRQTAYLDLFERYNRITHAFFRNRTGHTDLASELNQDLHLTVFAELDRFRLQSSYRTWLFRLARTRLWHLRRRLRVHLDEQSVNVDEGFWESIDAPPSDPDDQLDARRRRVALKNCLARLTEVERAVVFGQYCGGLTLEEITTALKLNNPSGARAPLIGAQRKLKRCLEAAGINSAGGVA